MNKATLGAAGVLEALSASQIWDRSSDLGETVQVSAIGVAKHLCSGNVDNTLRLVMPTDETASDKTDDDEKISGMDQILNLAGRSATIALKSEGARVLANAIKSLWSPADVSPAQRRKAVQRVTNFQSALALVELVGRSKKYPVLLNEGILALTLLSSQSTGASHVIQAVVSPLDIEPSPSDRTAALPSTISTNGPSNERTALDMLMIILANQDGKFPPQLRSNVCSLLGNLGRTRTPEEDSPDLPEESKAGVETIHRVARGALVSIAESTDVESPVHGAAQKAVLLWT